VTATEASPALPTAMKEKPLARAAVAGVGSVLALGCFARFGIDGQGLYAAAFVVVLAVLTVIDLEQRRLPNRIVVPGAAVALAGQLALQPDRALEWVLAAVGAALFFFLPLLFYPSGMGMGDVKLAFMLGAALGTSVVLALVIASFAVAGAGLALIVRHGASARKRPVPFGPFLAGGAVIALFAGGALPN
jgi:leader peptidase (prepilin peptidase) / N-methyltransferase